MYLLEKTKNYLHKLSTKLSKDSKIIYKKKKFSKSFPIQLFSNLLKVECNFPKILAFFVKHSCDNCLELPAKYSTTHL